MRCIALIAGLAACSGSGAVDAGLPDAKICPERGLQGAAYLVCDPGFAPVLACSGAGCNWSYGCCLSDAWQVSTCPPDDICCVEGSPFGADLAQPLVFQVTQLLHGFGSRPWDDARAMDVDVIVQPGLAAETPAYTCTGTDPIPGAQSPCWSFGAVPPAITGADGTHDRARRLWFWLGSRMTVSGWTPYVEIDPYALKARVCTYHQTDFIRITCGLEPRCASSGTVTLEHLPDRGADLLGVPGRLDAQIEDLHLVATF